MSTRITVETLQEDLESIIAEINRTGGHYIITQDGEDIAVLYPYEEYEDFFDELSKLPDQGDDHD